MDLAGLAPDEPAVEEPVMDLAGLAPDEPAVEEPVMDLAGLAPDEPAVEEPVMDLAGLAPDESAAEEPPMDLAGLAPDPPGHNTGGEAHVDDGEPVYTRTLAELYVRQGFTDKALEVYRRLAEAEPGAADLAIVAPSSAGSKTIGCALAACARALRRVVVPAGGMAVSARLSTVMGGGLPSELVQPAPNAVIQASQPRPASRARQPIRPVRFEPTPPE